MNKKNIKRKLPEPVRTVIDETRNELIKIYSSRLKDVILFGSYARGDFESGSDIDLAILIENSQDFIHEHDKYFPVTSRLSLKHDLVVSVVPLDYDMFVSRKTPLTLNIMAEGIRM